MAIDSKAKRASVQAYTLGVMRPPPDGTVDEGDRATVAFLYLGLDYNTPVVSDGGPSWFTGFHEFCMGFGGFF